MQDNTEHLIDLSVQYLSIAKEGLGDYQPELTAYANYLLGYDARTTSDTRIPEFRKWSAKELERIKSEITRGDVRSRICAVIQSMSNDTWDVAKMTVPTLVALSLSNVISLPQTPLYIAVAAIMIGRMGVATLCNE